jgi:uracil-DNA glycosylase
MILTKAVKFKTVWVNVADNPVIIVGQNPGRQRFSKQDFTVWSGNRSGDLLTGCLTNCDNYVLTNVCNYQDMTEQNISDGLKDLQVMISVLSPRKIICLGNFAYDYVKSMTLVPVIKLEHPSYIARFNKDKADYKRRLCGEVK